MPNEIPLRDAALRNSQPAGGQRLPDQCTHALFVSRLSGENHPKRDGFANCGVADVMGRERTRRLMVPTAAQHLRDHTAERAGLSPSRMATTASCAKALRAPSVSSTNDLTAWTALVRHGHRSIPIENTNDSIAASPLVTFATADVNVFQRRRLSPEKMGHVGDSSNRFGIGGIGHRGRLIVPVATPAGQAVPCQPRSARRPPPAGIRPFPLPVLARRDGADQCTNATAAAQLGP